jgi:predicted outer membrane repeat protein
MKTRTRFPYLAAAGAFLLLLVGAGISPAAAGDLYVDVAAAGANNGSSWADAYTDLQFALADAVDGDTIRVAQGTYTPTAGSDRTATFQLLSSVTLLGGYPTGGGTRDPKVNETVLSGDLGITGDTSDNSYHVVTGGGTDDTAVLDGFTITAGNADRADEWENKNGGGVHVDSGSPTLTRLTISDNSANYFGGGIYTSGWPCSPTLTDVTFSGNSASRGGGMYAKGNPTLSHVTFSNNSALGDGGGIDIDCPATLTNVTFSGNSAGNSGGGVYVDDKAGPTLTQVTFVNNQADADGDGYGSGGGLHNNDDTEMWIHNTILWGNTPDQLACNKGRIVITDSVVQGGLPADEWRFDVTNIITGDPSFGALGDHGGYTQTIPLLAGSSAIDAANSAYATDADQRDVARPQGAGCDIGAYEADAPPPALSFMSAGQNVPENVGRARVTAWLSTVTTQDVTFYFGVGGTAVNPDDYTVPMGWWRVTIPAGSLTGDVPIDIVNDSVGGPNETVVVSMDGVTNATYGAVTQHTLTIVNDDPVSDPATSLLSGRVTDAGGPRGVASVLVTATPAGNGKARTAVSDDGGYYCFARLLPGTYTVTASKTWSAFAPGPGSDEAAPVVTVSSAQHGVVDFRRVGRVMGWPAIAVESPNGGEEWAAGTTETIVWSAFDLDSNVRIELSRDGGNTYTTLFANTVNDGQETWPVSGPATGQTRIRISGIDPDVADVSAVSAGDFAITETDTTPPVLTAPPDVTAEQASAAGTAVALGTPQVHDDTDPNPTVTNNALPIFPPGTTTVTWTASDAAGNTATATQRVTVVDRVAPRISRVTASPDQLWPPNHQMLDVKVTVNASDACDPAPVATILSVTSSEPVNGLGDGDTAPDWVITAGLTVKLRAERAAKGAGRVYTIAVACTDASGNRSTGTVKVSVPRNQGGK